MNSSVRALLFLAAAIGLHAAALWGVRIGETASVSNADTGSDSTEVELVESAGETAPAEPPAPEQPPAQPAPPPTPEPIPPDAIPEPAPEPAKPEPPRPAPKPIAKAAPQKPVATAAPRSSGPPQGSTTGNSAARGSSAGKPGPGDNAHAKWRYRVQPTYPEVAKRAGLTGSVQIQVAVNALGQPSGVRIVKSSGTPMLDDAALRAVRGSTFHPKRVAGIPVPDTIIVPIVFRLEGRAGGY